MEAESFSVWHDGSALSLYPSSGSPFRCFDRFDECFYHLPSPRLSASLHITSSQDIPSFHLDIPIAAWHLHGMCRQLLFGGSRSQLITGLFDGPSQICQQTLQGAAWGMGWWVLDGSTFEVPKAAVFVISFLSKFHKVFECCWDWPWNHEMLSNWWIVI